ncbi:hypothetical protein AAG570_010177 [Ranatra chinensis]|uniref:PH domain-containing protein n=1 Tax=Ranatra chinensis TaxID=642074 RepID=A0ABD0YM01_9HEMI
MLLYSNLCGQTFKVHGELPVKSLTVQEREDNPTPNSFILYSDNRVLTVSANSQEEKDKWVEDLARAIEDSKDTGTNSLVSLRCSSSSDEVMDNCGQEHVRATPQRCNTTIHVCWHRNTSISLHDQIRAAQDDAPLASLPLLGYCVTTPSEKDNINKDFVFKLQFKNHVYFFRAESEYTFSRWMEVIGSATQHSGRVRLFSRKESALGDNL